MYDRCTLWKFKSFLGRRSPYRVRPSKGVKNRVWQSVALENTLEKAFKRTTFESVRIIIFLLIGVLFRISWY